MTTPTNPLLAHLLATPPFIPELHRDDCEDVACVRCIPTIGSPPRTPGEWDVPLATVEQGVAAQVLREAIAHEAELHDDYEVSALSEALFLVTHPEVPVSTDADYGTEWAAWLADRIDSNEQARRTR